MMWWPSSSAPAPRKDRRNIPEDVWGAGIAVVFTCKPSCLFRIEWLSLTGRGGMVCSKTEGGKLSFAKGAWSHPCLIQSSKSPAKSLKDWKPGPQTGPWASWMLYESVVDLGWERGPYDTKAHAGLRRFLAICADNELLQPSSFLFFLGSHQQYLLTVFLQGQ